MAELNQHEIGLITLLRMCKQHDEVRIVVDKNGWTAFIDKKEVVKFPFEGLEKKQE